MKYSDLKLLPDKLKRSDIASFLKSLKKSSTNKRLNDTTKTLKNVDGLTDNGPKTS